MLWSLLILLAVLAILAVMFAALIYSKRNHIQENYIENTIEDKKSSISIMAANIRMASTIKNIDEVITHVEENVFKNNMSTKWMYMNNKIHGVNEFLNHLIDEYGYSNPVIVASNPVHGTNYGENIRFTCVVLDKEVDGIIYQLALMFNCYLTPISKYKDISNTLKTCYEKGVDDEDLIWVTTTDPIYAMIPGLPEVDGEIFVQSPVKYKEISDALDANTLAILAPDFKPTIFDTSYSSDGGYYSRRRSVENPPQEGLMKHMYENMTLRFGDTVKNISNFNSLLAITKAAIKSGRSIILTDEDSVLQGGTGKTSFTKWLAQHISTNPYYSVVEMAGVPGGYTIELQEYIKSNITLLEHRIIDPEVTRDKEDKKHLVVIIDEAASIFLNEETARNFMAMMENTPKVDVSFILTTNHLTDGLPAPFKRSGRVIRVEIGKVTEKSMLPIFAELQTKYTNSESYIFDTNRAKELLEIGSVTINDVYSVVVPRAFNDDFVEDLLNEALQDNSSDDDPDDDTLDLIPVKS